MSFGVKQERYASMLLEKLRHALETKVGVVVNNRYEGDPKAGAVKIPVRGEATARQYNPATGIALEIAETSWATLLIDQDYAVNELIDNYTALTVPDNVVADRLDSAAYALANVLDNFTYSKLLSEGTLYSDVAAITKDTVYRKFLNIKVAMTRAKVPARGRFALCDAETIALILESPVAIKSGDLSQDLVMQGVIAQIAGFNIIESSKLNTVVTKAQTVDGPTTYDWHIDFIAGHPDYVSRVDEWKVMPDIFDLNGSKEYVGASAVKGRRVYGGKVTHSECVFVRATRSIAA